MSGTKIETDFLLVLRPEPSRPDGPTVHQRLRSAPKWLLRSQGLRCIRIAPDLPTELPAPEPGLDVMKDEPPFAGG